MNPHDVYSIVAEGCCFDGGSCLLFGFSYAPSQCTASTPKVDDKSFDSEPPSVESKVYEKSLDSEQLSIDTYAQSPGVATSAVSKPGVADSEPGVAVATSAASKPSLPLQYSSCFDVFQFAAETAEASVNSALAGEDRATAARQGLEDSDLHEQFSSGGVALEVTCFIPDSESLIERNRAEASAI